MIETAIGKRRSAVISWVATFRIYIVRALTRQVMKLATVDDRGPSEVTVVNYVSHWVLRTSAFADSL